MTSGRETSIRSVNASRGGREASIHNHNATWGGRESRPLRCYSLTGGRETITLSHNRGPCPLLVNRRERSNWNTSHNMLRRTMPDKEGTVRANSCSGGCVQTGRVQILSDLVTGEDLRRLSKRCTPSYSRVMSWRDLSIVKRKKVVPSTLRNKHSRQLDVELRFGVDPEVQATHPSHSHRLAIPNQDLLLTRGNVYLVVNVARIVGYVIGGPYCQKSTPHHLLAPLLHDPRSPSPRHPRQADQRAPTQSPLRCPNSTPTD